MIFPFMAIYFTRELNAAYAGVLLLIQVILQFLVSLYGGFLADALGRKKMMVIGEWMKAAAFLGMILANSPWYTSPWFTFAMLLVMSTATGFINPAADAMMIDVSTKENRALMYSINYWAVNMSLMLGLSVGGWFFTTHFFELLIVLLIISLLTLSMTVMLIKETNPPASREGSRNSFGLKPLLLSYKTVIRDFPFALFTLGGIAILSIEFQRNNFISVRLEKEFGDKVFSLLGGLQLTLDGVKVLSLLTVINTLMIVIFTAFVAKWLKNKHEQSIMYAGFLLFGAGYSILAFSNSLAILAFAVVILSIGELLYVPTRQSVLADIVDDTRRGAYMAVNGLIFQGGKIFGVLGIMAGDKMGGTGMAILYLILAILGILFSHLAIFQRNKPGEREVISKAG